MYTPCQDRAIKRKAKHSKQSTKILLYLWLRLDRWVGRVVGCWETAAGRGYLTLKLPFHTDGPSSITYKYTHNQPHTLNLSLWRTHKAFQTGYCERLEKIKGDLLCSSLETRCHVDMRAEIACIYLVIWTDGALPERKQNSALFKAR
jgi:hypothetical protein